MAHSAKETGGTHARAGPRQSSNGAMLLKQRGSEKNNGSGVEKARSTIEKRMRWELADLPVLQIQAPTAPTTRDLTVSIGEQDNIFSRPFVNSLFGPAKWVR